MELKYIVVEFEEESELYITKFEFKQPEVAMDVRQQLNDSHAYTGRSYEVLVRYA
jgi:hypothetical protein